MSMNPPLKHVAGEGSIFEGVGEKKAAQGKLICMMVRGTVDVYYLLDLLPAEKKLIERSGKGG